MGLSLWQCPTPTHSVPPVPSLMVAITSFITPGYMFVCYCVQVPELCLTLWHHELQHTRLPSLSLSYRVCSNSHPLSWWCHPTISSSVAPLSCLWTFPTSGPSPVSQLFTSGGQIWSFSFSISPSNEYSGLISFRIDRFDLLAVQGTLKSLLQHHSSKASILQHSAFFIVQLSHPYMTTGKTIALTLWTFVGKVVSLLFNMLFRLGITFLPRSKSFKFHGCSHHLQWFWSPPK